MKVNKQSTLTNRNKESVIHWNQRLQENEVLNFLMNKINSEKPTSLKDVGLKLRIIPKEKYSFPSNSKAHLIKISFRILKSDHTVFQHARVKKIWSTLI